MEQTPEVKRITTASIIHEVFHYFTHLDKGFPLTMKQLISKPGAMQREYIAGDRARHQKPFSMFFICITITALGLYWINRAVVTYFGGDNNEELRFFQQYMVWLQLLLLPLYAMVVYLVFYKSSYNYGEILVLTLYMFSFLFIILLFVHLLKFIVPDLNTRFIESPAILAYSLATNLRFFISQSRLAVVIKTIICCALIFLIAAFCQDAFISLILHK